MKRALFTGMFVAAMSTVACGGSEVVHTDLETGTSYHFINKGEHNGEAVTLERRTLEAVLIDVVALDSAVEFNVDCRACFDCADSSFGGYCSSACDQCAAAYGEDGDDNSNAETRGAGDSEVESRGTPDNHLGEVFESAGNDLQEVDTEEWGLERLPRGPQPGGELDSASDKER